MRYRLTKLVKKWWQETQSNTTTNKNTLYIKYFIIYWSNQTDKWVIYKWACILDGKYIWIAELRTTRSRFITYRSWSTRCVRQYCAANLQVFIYHKSTCYSFLYSLTLQLQLSRIWLQIIQFYIYMILYWIKVFMSRFKVPVIFGDIFSFLGDLNFHK